MKSMSINQRRKTNEVQVVRLNSTGEGMNKINTGGKSRENCASTVLACETISKRKH